MEKTPEDVLSGSESCRQWMALPPTELASSHGDNVVPKIRKKPPLRVAFST